MEFAGRGVLLDIEGTTSSIRFVYDVMFPFVRRELEGALAALPNRPDLAAACEQIASEAGHASLAAWQRASGEQDVKSLIRAEVLRLMDGDVKSTGLKQLQGILWQAGFESGELKAHLYDDVFPAVGLWNRAGLDVRIYSSGSVQAQKLFFGHTIHGDLLALFRGHYDTTTGGKRAAESYRLIAAAFELPASEVLFLSDVVAELDAARTAGMQTGLCLRPGNAPAPAGHSHAEIASFDEIVISNAGR